MAATLHLPYVLIDAEWDDMKDGKSVMVEGGRLSSVARRAIAGYMKCAAALTAFGDTNPTSYFRLVPHQEAPTSICWGDRNRSVLVRVPLGWTGESDMLKAANPLEIKEYRIPDKQTVEMRSPDGSADIYNMMAGLVTAARIGLTMNEDEALKIAGETYVDVNIHARGNEAKLNSLKQLPASCKESADALEQARSMFEASGVFSPALIDGTIAALRAFGDSDIRREVAENGGKMMELVNKYYYCG